LVFYKKEKKKKKLKITSTLVFNLSGRFTRSTICSDEEGEEAARCLRDPSPYIEFK